MVSKKRPNVESSAIVTRSSKAKLDANSEPPKSKKAKTNISESAAVVTRSSTRRQRDKAIVDYDPEQPKSKKAKKNTPDSDRASSSKTKANMEPSTIASRRKQRKIKKRVNVEASASGKGKAKLETISDKGNGAASKKSENVKPSFTTRPDKGKGKMSSSDCQIQSLNSQIAKLTIISGETTTSSEGSAHLPQPPEQTSGVITRRGRGKMVITTASTSTRVTRSSTRRL